eukprot:CAMPEP_0172784554 /NCGR_PEP_ID=MMETSP1074-20121228/204999_1 /TAXON_ID=2916 /ORGANISM="Ceratium fusus, Strain PA161109" /LENGTH=215 /DNA_ID=CAMNT_0013621557 /DNA_START=698 /DNA_END=1346 /DNA_ORIENTATION=+
MTTSSTFFEQLIQPHGFVTLHVLHGYLVLSASLKLSSCYFWFESTLVNHAKPTLRDFAINFQFLKRDHKVPQDSILHGISKSSTSNFVLQPVDLQESQHSPPRNTALRRGSKPKFILQLQIRHLNEVVYPPHFPGQDPLRHILATTQATKESRQFILTPEHWAKYRPLCVYNSSPVRIRRPRLSAFAAAAALWSEHIRTMLKCAAATLRRGMAAV